MLRVAPERVLAIAYERVPAIAYERVLAIAYESSGDCSCNVAVQCSNFGENDMKNQKPQRGGGFVQSVETNVPGRWGGDKGEGERSSTALDP